MWIAKIELLYFKSYLLQTFEFPQPEVGRNIVLIGGMNGYGKTSVLEAIYLGLYGKEAVEHLGRAGLIKDEVGYKRFLERAFHGEAIRTGQDTMWVKIQINRTKAEGFEVKRKWYFTPRGWTGDEEVLIYPVRDGIRSGSPQPAENLPEILDREFIPVHIAPFFFFDGEEVKKLAEQGTKSQIRYGIEGLLGVDLLRKLNTRLGQFQASKSTGIAVVDEQKHRELSETLSKDKAEYEEVQKKHEMLVDKVESLKAQRASIMNTLMQLGAGSGNVASAADIIKQQKDAETELNETAKALDDVVATKLPFHLVAPNLMESLSKQIQTEIEREDWENRKRSLEPGKDKFIGTFYNTKEPPIQPELTAEQKLALQTRLNVAWESLFYPMPEGCAQMVFHDYLGSKRKTLLQTINGLHMGAQDVLGLVSKQESLQKKIDELVSRYSKIEGHDRDGTLAKLNADSTEVNKQLDQYLKEEGDSKRQLTSLKSQIDIDQATYNREHEKFVQANPAKSMVACTEKVCNLIDDLIPQLYALKVKQLAEVMTGVYKQLAHKKIVDRIEIKEDGETRLMSKEGEEIPFDKSAGENQVFATALLAGLAQMSRLGAPLVVDTPLGRLDSKHRTNILNYWISNQERQVILLSQDKEIDPDTYIKMKSSVAKTYLLLHEEAGNGIGRTVAVEDQYFEDLPK